MRYRLCAGLLGLALVLPFVAAGDNVKSGPQVGQDVPGPFHPLNLTGEAAGRKNCLYCAYGTNPVAVVFARELTPPVQALLKQIERATGQKQGEGLCSFAVFCSDDEKLADQIKEFASREKIARTILAIDNPAGPEAYKISKDAEVTVFYYADLTVKTNHAFRKGELNDAAVARVVADVRTHLPK